MRIALFRVSRNIGDFGDKLIFSMKKTLYKPETKEKTTRLLKKVLRTGDKIASNIKENTQNWGERIEFGDSFLINKEDV